MVSLFVISGSSKTSSEDNLPSNAGAHIMEKEEDLDDEVEPNDRQRVSGKKIHVFAISTATIIFQLLLILTSMYYAMLCTNWGNLNVYTDSTINPTVANDGSDLSFWLKLISEWITMSVYLFSLLAPLFFDRDFN